MKISALMIGATLADYPGYTIPTNPQMTIWKLPEQEQAFENLEGQKEYVKYQMPDDEFVPVSDLPVVFLNGIKFHRQGKQPRPHDLERFRKITRSSNGQLSCKGGKEAKEAHKEHMQARSHVMQMDHVEFIGVNPKKLDLVKTIFQTKYPRYNGRDAPLKYNELLVIPDLTNLEPQNEEEWKMIQNDWVPREEGEYDPEAEEEEFYEEVHFPSEEYRDPVVVDEEDDREDLTDEELEEIRLAELKKMFKSQANAKIGCCNGLPYNSSKRCCCRRIPFDKDKKFCCAINGCQSFQVFDRSNAQHYKDCLSLSGLVIQEYGYRGLPNQGAAFAGFQNKAVKARPGPRVPRT